MTTEAWETEMQRFRDQVVAAGRRTETIARVFVLLFGREHDPINARNSGELAAADRYFTNPATVLAWARPAYASIMAAAATPAPVRRRHTIEDEAWLAADNARREQRGAAKLRPAYAGRRVNNWTDADQRLMSCV